MKEQCFDAGTIQSFLDGELAAEMLENVARHVALCDSCAYLLSEAEEESAFAFKLLDEEFNTLVPTERIRANVFQAIEKIEKPKVSIWEKVWGFASILSNPSVAAFASLFIVAGVFVIVFNFNKQDEGYQSVANSVNKINKIANITLQPTIIGDFSPQSPSNFDRINYKTRSNFDNQKSKIKNQKSNDQTPKFIQLVDRESIDGEDTYLKTISTLENTVKDKKDNVLRASSRVSYERDMAVVNDSIIRMKQEVRKNPKNEAAKQILRNSYQTKIELLNSVSERSELIARMD